MPGAGIEHYMFSIPIGYVASGNRNIYSIGLRFPHESLPDFLLHNSLRSLVPGAGIEPARPYGHKILSLAWLPITPPGQKNRTIEYFTKAR